MAERTRWKQKHDALEIELNRLQADLDVARSERDDLQESVDSLKAELNEARSAIGRARIEGMHAASGALLSAE